MLITGAVVTWICALCYAALLGARDQDHGQTLGVTLSVILSASLLLTVVSTTCMLCTGFSLLGCPVDHPIKKVSPTEGQKVYYLPDDPGYDQVKPDTCAATAQGLEQQGYRRAVR
jgi:hypothetical protein